MNRSVCRFFINSSVLADTSPIFCVTKHHAMLRSTTREEGDTKDFLSLSKKVFVTLIRFICSFFSTARRTNQEAPPLLSGFWVRRYGRRRGLRNSLRSDSPRPFSSVFLATSPPDKGGIGGSCLYFNPFALRALSLYSLTETQGERRVNSITPTSGIFNPFPRRYAPQFSPYIFLHHTPQCFGARQGGEGWILIIFFPCQR